MSFMHSALTAVTIASLWTESSAAQNGIGRWENYPSYSGMQGLAWCLQKDNNKLISKKAMGPPSICAGVIAKNPLFAGITEHDAAAAAIAIECQRVSVLGFEVGSATAMEFLVACQCHDPNAIAGLLRDEVQVRQALRVAGGCQ